MEANFQRAIRAVLKSEGGYVDDPRDRGGATNMGITHKTLARWRNVSPWTALPKQAVKDLTEAEAVLIYKGSYWDEISGDNLPPGVDYAVLDYAVNSGPFRAAATLQEIVGAAPDGDIGPVTLLAVSKWDSVRLIEELCAKRMTFLKKLSNYPTYRKGWSRRVTEVLRLAKDMAITMPAKAPEAPKPTLPQVPPDTWVGPYKRPSTTPPSTPAPSLWERFIAAILAIFRKD